MHRRPHLHFSFNNQLLDEIFVIFRIIKVEIRAVSRSRMLRLITPTETLIILDIQKPESNNCLLYIEYRDRDQDIVHKLVQ